MELAADLRLHMQKEEWVLFPAIRAIEGGAHQGMPISAPVGVMAHEHDRAGRVRSELREITGGYVVPLWACGTFRALYHGLSELEATMHVHVHLENNFGEAIANATESIEQSRTRGRPQYEALGLTVRARGLHAMARTHSAIADARCAVDVAGTTGDPALLLVAFDVLLELDGSDDLAQRARALSDLVHDALPDEGMRGDFRGSEVVRRIGRRG